MALLSGGATSDRVDNGTLGSLNPTTGTMMVWCKPSAAGDVAVWSKDIGSGSTTTGWCFRFQSGHLSGLMGRATASANYRSNGFTITTDKWWCFAITFDKGGGAGVKMAIYYGDLSSSMTAASITVVAEGTGGFNSLATYTNRWGNRTGNAVAFTGDIAPGAFWGDRILTLGEMINWQYSLTVPGTQPHVFNQLGFNGTGTQTDYSGNGNAGTVTGMTLANNHVPILWLPDRSIQAAYTSSVVVSTRLRMLMGFGI